MASSVAFRREQKAMITLFWFVQWGLQHIASRREQPDILLAWPMAPMSCESKAWHCDI